MKILTAIATTALLSMSMASTASASSVFFKSPINFAGTGCPAGSIAVSGANTDTLSILFDGYDAGKDSVSGVRRAACSFAVPVHVPQGYQVSVMTADWQGYAEGKVQLKRKYFFAGQPNTPWLTSNINSSNGTDFLKRDNMQHRTLTWAGCGRSVNLRINSNLRAKTRNSYAAIDTLDLKNKVKFHLKWRRCH
ncbi:MAG: DUF4360 domain-containing protein [Thiolinea sp.]